MELDHVTERPAVRPKEPEPQPTPKQQPSVFDRVLQQARLGQQAPTALQQNSRQGGEEGKEERRSHHPSDRRRDGRWRRDREIGGTKHDRVVREKGERGADHRIVVKTQLKRDQGGGGRGGSGGQTGGGGQGARGKEAVTRAGRQEAKTIQAAHTAASFAAQLIAPTAVPAALSRQHLGQLVNKLVAYIRVGRTVVGDAELQIGFHAAVFHGLRLRLTANNGKVTVQFASPDAAVRLLFQREQRRIRRELELRGIHIDAIHVIGC